MREDSYVPDEEKAAFAKAILIKNKVERPAAKSPIEYTTGAIAEIERQLLTAKGVKRIEKLNRALRRWKLTLESLK